MKVFDRIFKGKPTPEKKSSTLFHSNPQKKQRKRISTTPIIRFAWFTVGIFVIVAVGFSFFLPAIRNANALDYFDYVSELRSNILVAETENYFLKAYAVEKEYPYSADGVRREMTKRAEVYFTAPSGDKTCRVSFSVNGETYGGEASYDNVKAEYFFSVSADLCEAQSADFTVVYGEETLVMTAKTVKTPQTLSPRDALNKLRENEPTVFETLTDENGFVGEIYLRLISEDAPYYYVGLIQKNGRIQAYLLSSDSGKILAKRVEG